MGQRESSTSTETSSAETIERINDPKERRRSLHLRRSSRAVEFKNVDESGETSPKNKGRKKEESNLNGRRQSRQRSKSVAVDLNMFDTKERSKDKTKIREVKSLEETSRFSRFRASFSGGGWMKNKGRGSITSDQTKQKKKDLGVKFWEDDSRPGSPLVSFNLDERRQSRQRRKSKDRRDSKSLSPTSETKQKSKARRAKSMGDIRTPGRHTSRLDSIDKTQQGRRSSQGQDPDKKSPKEKAKTTMFNTFQALRLIDGQLERIAKNEECLLMLSKNIQNLKNKVKTMRSSTTERRDKLWDKFEDWQKLVEGFDYPIAHLGAMMNVDMNFLRRLKYLDYVTAHLDTLKENCRKLEKEKEIAEDKHQEERQKLLNERTKLEKVQSGIEDMFPSIRRKMRRKERELHLSTTGTETQSHYEASKKLSKLLSQIHTSFAHLGKNFQPSSV